MNPGMTTLLCTAVLGLGIGFGAASALPESRGRALQETALEHASGSQTAGLRGAAPLRRARTEESDMRCLSQE